MSDYIRFTDVVSNVASDRPEGYEQLYRVFRMLSAPLRRQFGYQDFEDRLHDVYLIVVEAIRSGKFREPAALPSYIQGVARFVLCSHVNTRSRRRRLYPTLRHWHATHISEHDPEGACWKREQRDIMRKLLAELNARERDILIRFYIDEQSKEEICRDLSITETQFRLGKSRAKAHLTRLGAERLAAA